MSSPDPGNRESNTKLFYLLFPSATQSLSSWLRSTGLSCPFIDDHRIFPSSSATSFLIQGPSVRSDLSLAIRDMSSGSSRTDINLSLLASGGFLAGFVENSSTSFSCSWMRQALSDDNTVICHKMISAFFFRARSHSCCVVAALVLWSEPWQDGEGHSDNEWGGWF